ncbi:MAG: hypothetical protein EU539_13115 [Promethearchaeota archaeon]|nr:MAG: hypothetical protein EU539_13115 [Candidatus Lokiarchaeota archaeon]
MKKESIAMTCLLIICAIFFVGLFIFLRDLHLTWFKNNQTATFWTFFWYVLFVLYSIASVGKKFSAAQISDSNVSVKSGLYGFFGIFELILMIIMLIAGYPYFLEVLGLWFTEETAFFWINFWYFAVIIPAIVVGFIFPSDDESGS